MQTLQCAMMWLRCEKVRAQTNADWGELRIIFNVLNLAPPFTLQGAGTKHAEIQSSVGEYTVASIGRMNGIKWIGRQLLHDCGNVMGVGYKYAWELHVLKSDLLP